MVNLKSGKSRNVKPIVFCMEIRTIKILLVQLVISRLFIYNSYIIEMVELRNNGSSVLRKRYAGDKFFIRKEYVMSKKGWIAIALFLGVSIICGFIFQTPIYASYLDLLDYDYEHRRKFLLKALESY